MGKNRKSSSKSSANNSNETSTNTSSGNSRSSRNRRESQQQAMSRARSSSSARITLREWLSQDYQGLYWVIGCIVMGGILGFAIGAGWGEFSGVVSPWRQNLGRKIRSTAPYQLVTLQGPVWDDWLDRFAEWAERVEREVEVEEYAKDPSHPRVFAVLREAVIREKGGYVHHDLGFLVPAPSGGSRGIGMIRDSYHKCQTKCKPGTANDKLQARLEAHQAKNGTSTIPLPGDKYRQEEVLLRIPLNFQMRRSIALEVLLTLVPSEVQAKASLHELDDAALLVLYLAHERGVGKYSRWLPYIASLPAEPSCGYSKSLRPYMLDSINALRDELGVDVQGWSGELAKAAQYADRIAGSLNRDFGSYIETPEKISSLDNIHWALCQVTSRATAGDEKYGSLRLVPILDLINHDSNAGGFVELTGKEKLDNGDFVDAREEDGGSFVVRSLRHGRRKALRKRQELLANYNIPHYSPLDWLVSMGFIPPERWAPWQKIEPVLPRVRKDGPFAGDFVPTEQLLKKYAPTLLQDLKHSDLLL